MAWGDPLKRGDRGADVIELQMRLAGFRGTLPDGDYGPGTELQVMAFQRDVMGQTSPSGQGDAATLAAIDKMAADYPIDFAQLRCRCGVCGGFGRGLNKGKYRGTIRTEAYHRYEYPGIHRMILWACRAAMFYGKARGWAFGVNSGYRCSEDNRQHGRSSTNHMGKAIDMDILNPPSKPDDMRRCNELRGLLVEKANAQIGWGAANRKSLEPETIAPTWVHYDVRSYDAKYLADRYFVKTLAELDAAPAAA